MTCLSKDIYHYWQIFFEYFRDLCLSTYDFDPAHFHPASRLGWFATLRMKKIHFKHLAYY